MPIHLMWLLLCFKMVKMINFTFMYFTTITIAIAVSFPRKKINDCSAAAWQFCNILNACFLISERIGFSPKMASDSRCAEKNEHPHPTPEENVPCVCRVGSLLLQLQKGVCAQTPQLPALFLYGTGRCGTRVLPYASRTLSHCHFIFSLATLNGPAVFHRRDRTPFIQQLPLLAGPGHLGVGTQHRHYRAPLVLY